MSGTLWLKDCKNPILYPRHFMMLYRWPGMRHLRRKPIIEVIKKRKWIHSASWKLHRDRLISFRNLMPDFRLFFNGLLTKVCVKAYSNVCFYVCQYIYILPLQNKQPYGWLKLEVHISCRLFCNISKPTKYFSPRHILTTRHEFSSVIGYPQRNNLHWFNIFYSLFLGKICSNDFFSL